MLSLAAAALLYARVLALKIFPCAPRSKRPLTLHGHLDATTDLDTITQWWRRWPNANPAMSCAACRRVVLDVDPRAAAAEALAAFCVEHHATLAGTWGVLTSRDGRHYHLTWPPDAVDEQLRFMGAVLPGVEVKARGYVLLPPTVHPLGDVYRFIPGQSPRDFAPELGLAPLVCPPELWARMTRPAMARGPAPRGPVTDSLLAELCAQRGLIRGALGTDRLAIWCPWRVEHTVDGGFGEAVLFASAEPGGLGMYFCAHVHCRGRGPHTLLAQFTRAEICAARAALEARGIAERPRRLVVRVRAPRVRVVEVG